MSDSKKIGRPKKNISITPDQYYNICTEPKSATSVVEFSNTEPFDMSKYLKTLKSNDILELFIECQADRVIFWGKMLPKIYSSDYCSNNNNYMFLIYRCSSIYRYYCKHPVFININERESITNLLGEINESSGRIKMVVESNFTDSINFSIYNATLKSKNRFSVDCVVEFHQSVKIMKRPTIVKTQLYGEMLNMQISEYKKELNSRFKKKVVSSKVLFDKDKVIFDFMKDHNKTLRATFDTDGDVEDGKQQVKIYVEGLTELNYPKNNISDFLLHIKGRFDIQFYKECIIVSHRDKNILLVSVISNDD